MNKKNIKIKCDCGCSILTIAHEKEDNIVYIEHYYNSFYGKQTGILTILKERLSMIWFIIRGKEFFLYDIIIQGDDIKEFKEYLKDLLEEL